jgi:hypothetical protein
LFSHACLAIGTGIASSASGASSLNKPSLPMCAPPLSPTLTCLHPRRPLTLCTHLPI